MHSPNQINVVQFDTPLEHIIIINPSNNGRVISATLRGT